MILLPKIFYLKNEKKDFYYLKNEKKDFYYLKHSLKKGKQKIIF